MRVLKWGKSFDENTHKAKCLECGCVIQFCEEEASFGGTAKDSYFLEIRCPTCAGTIYHCVRLDAQRTLSVLNV